MGDLVDRQLDRSQRRCRAALDLDMTDSPEPADDQVKWLTQIHDVGGTEVEIVLLCTPHSMLLDRQTGPDILHSSGTRLPPYRLLFGGDHEQRRLDRGGGSGDLGEDAEQRGGKL